MNKLSTLVDKVFEQGKYNDNRLTEWRFSLYSAPLFTGFHGEFPLKLKTDGLCNEKNLSTQ